MTAHLLADSGTMLGRSLRRMRRYPSLTLFVAGMPVVLLLLFVYVFGGALGAGLGVQGGGCDCCRSSGSAPTIQDVADSRSPAWSSMPA